MKIPSILPRESSRFNNFLRGGVALAMLAGAAGWTHAAEVSWGGFGSTNKFTDDANWMSGLAPVAADTVIVASGAPTVLIEDGDAIAFSQLQFGTGEIAMSGGTVTTTGRQYFGYGDEAVNLTMSGGTWTTTERFLLGYQSDNFSATLSGGTSTSDRTTIGSSGQYLIVGNGGAAGEVTLNDYAQLYGNTTTKFIIADGSGNSATVTMNDHSHLYSKTELNVGWNSGNGTLAMSGDSTVVSDGSVKIGIQNGVGQLTMNGNTSLTSAGEIVVGNSGGTGSLEMSGSANLNGTDLDIGRDGTGSGSLSLDGSSSVVLSGSLSIGRNTSSANEQSLSMAGESTLSASNVYVSRWGFQTAQNAALYLSGNASMTTGSFALGYGDGGGAFRQAKLEMSGTSSISMSESASTVKWGAGAGSVTATLSDSSKILASNTTLMLGDSGGSGSESAGTITLEDSSKLSVKSLIVGHYGSHSETGWTVNVGSATGTQSATLTATDGIILGRSDNSGGGNFSVALNIYNGVVETSGIMNGGGADITKHKVLIDGGTIRSLANSSEFFTQYSGVGNQVVVTIAAGGATFDTNGFDVETALGFAGEGGLIKEGTGALTLSGASTYTGTTVVAGGTFVVSGSLASQLLQVDSGAVLSLESLALLATAGIDLSSGAALQMFYGAEDLELASLTVAGVAVGAGTYSVSELTALGLLATFTGDTSATLTIIPEPSTYALLGAGLLTGLAVVRRRRK